jgi:hypothetical protein
LLSLTVRNHRPLHFADEFLGNLTLDVKMLWSIFSF